MDFTWTSCTLIWTGNGTCGKEKLDFIFYCWIEIPFRYRFATYARHLSIKRTSWPRRIARTRTPACASRSCSSRSVNWKVCAPIWRHLLSNSPLCVSSSIRRSPISIRRARSRYVKLAHFPNSCNKSTENLRLVIWKGSAKLKIRNVDWPKTHLLRLLTKFMPYHFKCSMELSIGHRLAVRTTASTAIELAWTKIYEIC